MKQETQQCIIGVIAFHGQKALATCVKAGMEPDWFSDDPKAFYTAALELFSTGKPIDAMTLPQKASSVPDAVIQLSQWMTDAPVISHLEYYIDMARGEHKLTLAKHQIAITNNKIAMAETDTIDEILAEAQFDWARIGMAHTTQKLFGEVATDLVAQWQLPKTEEEINAVLWPSDQLNRVIGALDDEYVILAARPSVGKTAFMVQMQAMLGLRSIRSATASLESSARKLAMRAISYLGNVNALRLRRKEYTDEEIQAAVKAAEKLKELPISVADNGMTLDQIRAFAIAEKAAGARIIFIDNAKQIRPNKKYGSTVEQFRDISQQVKWIRDDIGIPVVLLHHLSEEMKLSWSSDFERDADIIIHMLDNEDLSMEPCEFNGYQGRFIVDLELKKNRDGPPGMKVKQQFLKDVQSFRDYHEHANYEVESM